MVYLSLICELIAGAHPKAIQERLGHHSAAFTLDRYGHLFESLDQELAERLHEARPKRTAAYALPAADSEGVVIPLPAAE